LYTNPLPDGRGNEPEQPGRGFIAPAALQEQPQRSPAGVSQVGGRL